MGDLVGHVLPGTLLLAVGLWRVWSSVARIAADPPAFRVRAWNAISAPAAPRLLELYVVAGGAFLDMCVELYYASPLPVVLTGGVDVDINPAAHLGGLEHAGMLLMFVLYGVLALVSEKKNTRWLPAPLPDAALSLVFASAFTAEYLLFHFHSTTHTGLEGYYHGHLLVLLALCVAALVAGALLPSSFPADIGAAVLIAVQGMWFYQTGLTLYGPMIPAGCFRRFDDSPRSDARVECPGGGGGGGAALERAEMLADFQLFGIVFVAFVYVLGCFAVAAARYEKDNLELTTTAGHHEQHVAATATATATAMEDCTTI